MFRTPTFILRQRLAASVAALLLVCGLTAQAQTSSFTYQGRLTDGAMPANGAYEMEFKLYDALIGGAQQPQPTPVTIALTDANGNAVVVTNGLFTVQLDFGSEAFPGAPRYLEIAVRHAGETSFVPLLPRQQISSLPYAIRSSSATTADNATELANQLSGAGTLNRPDNPVDWTQLKNVPAAVTSSYTAGPGISIVGQIISNTGVRTVAASGPLSSSGGQHPTITLSGVVPVSRGGTGSATKDFVDLSTDQFIDGLKTFSKVIVDGGLTLSGRSQFIRYDPALVATLRWDHLLSSGDFATGNGPGAVAFDGANIWVANTLSNNVTKLRAADGTHLGTFPVGLTPSGLAFDGENIWVTNYDSNNVTKLSASDGEHRGTFPVGQKPVDIAFDGSTLWVVNSSSGNVTKLRATDGMNLGAINVSFAAGVAFDGINIWVTGASPDPQDPDFVAKLTQREVSVFVPLDRGPTDIAFDGTNIWVLTPRTGSVTKLRTSDGAKLGTFPVGANASNVAFDGENIWVTNTLTDTVTKVRARDGANLGAIGVGRNPAGVVFDGATIWVANVRSNTVSKL